MSDVGQQIDWPVAASKLAHRVGAGAIEPSVLQVLEQPSVTRVLVACSGGADSVFLLCLLYARAEALGLELHIAHYNHRWRGEASDADAAFVESLAEAFHRPAQAGARPEHEAAFTETTARALRLDFLRKSAEEAKCSHILYGHQLDDILETQLQRIGRGCASDGLAAPRPVAQFDQHPTHLRPLLHLRAADIRMALNSCGIPWLEDSSNADVSIARNLLRHQVIPDLTDALGRNPSVGAARSRRLLEEDATALHLLARAALPAAFSAASSLATTDLQASPRAIVRRALAAWLSDHGLIASFSASAMDILVEAIYSDQPSHRMSAGQDYIAIEQGRLRIERSDEVPAAAELQPVQLSPGELVLLSTGGALEAEWLEVDEWLLARLASGEVDPRREAIIACALEPLIAVRAWQPGDRYHPLGAPGSKKLKDCFIDRHIPIEERKRLPLVLNAAKEVVWVPGLPPAEQAKVLPSTKQALRLTYETRNPL